MKADDRTLYGTNDYADAVYALVFNETYEDLPFDISEEQVELIPAI